MSDDEKNGKGDKKNGTNQKKPDHEPPAGAETTATWSGGPAPLEYTATAKWLVLRKKEKPAAEKFSVSYVAVGGDEQRPVTFVFNGGPGASSAYLHLGAVGPLRVDFPPDGSLPAMPPRLVQNEASWLAFTDLVFVDPVGTGFSRIIENEKSEEAKDKKDDAPDPKEYFGQKRDLESLSEFMAAGCRLSGGGGRRSSSPARARAAIGWVGWCGCCRRARASGSTGRSSSRPRSRSRR
jgi:carboxypeptidase C (cathepsin A)